MVFQLLNSNINASTAIKCFMQLNSKQCRSKKLISFVSFKEGINHLGINHLGKLRIGMLKWRGVGEHVLVYPHQIKLT